MAENTVSVDGELEIADARLDVFYAIQEDIEGEAEEATAAVHKAFDHYRTAILKHDPVAVALVDAADAANYILSELSSDPPNDVRPSWKRQIIEASLDMDTALAAYLTAVSQEPVQEGQ